MQTFKSWQGLCLSLFALLITSGCESLSPQPTAAAATMAGNWREDPARSDDFERQLASVIQQVRRREQPRPPWSAPPEAGSTAAAQIDPLLMPPEEPDKLRARLGDDLRPAAALRIALLDDGVAITRDAEPTREFRPSQTVSRIDTSGAASVQCGWDQGAFVIHAKYTTRGTRSWRLQHDATGDTLQITFEANNPEFGHLVLHTLYRRAPAAAP